MNEKSPLLSGDSPDSIPVINTPEGGFKEFPDPFLSTCTTNLVDSAPDLRGVWRVYEVQVDGELQQEHLILGSIQRIEQSGDRIIITSGGVIHDMRCDGTEENGVNDVMAADYKTPIKVKATYENQTHILRPEGLPIEVKRWREGEELVWEYVGFTARLKKIGSANDSLDNTQLSD
ncbi:MAG: hypothetical protein VX843_02875 [Actinomycetota bacterium]|nr:hypothetical protein [Actinomycetota bacterium]